MKLSGKIAGLATDFVTNEVKLTLSIFDKNELVAEFDELKEIDKLDIEIVKHRKKRSLNANAYCWVLIGKIADKLRAGKDEVYLTMLKRYGQSEVISVLATIEISQYIKYCDEIGESRLNNKLFKHYKVYKGSSEYTTEEMAILIDGVVSEADALNIQTLTPTEIAKIKSMWGAGNER